MTTQTLRPLTRREFLSTAIGIFSLVVGCSRDVVVTEKLPTSETRTITHALGVTEAPKIPQRIVALSGISDLEALLVLVVKPLAAAGDDRRSLGQTVWNLHLEDRMQDIEMLPSRRQISLEKLTALQPDLIIGTLSPLRPIISSIKSDCPNRCHRYPVAMAK